MVMSRKYLSLGVSALALTLVASSYAEAQQNLPTINVGGARKNTKKIVSSSTPTGGRATGASSATGGNGGGTGGFSLDRYSQPAPAPFTRGVPANIPAVVESRTREEIYKQVNVMTSAEVFKYLPSVMVRERYIGDNNAIVTMRTNGPTESANTLVYANGVLLSNLLGNSFAFPPRWGFVSPEEIDRVDVIYGPFSALYQGNSVSGVMTMTTKMPDAREIHVKGTGAAQQWSLYNHSSVPLNGNVNIFYGDRVNDFRYVLVYNHLDAQSQPQWYNGANQIVPGTGGVPVFGGYSDYGTYGAPRIITGANSITHQTQDLAKVRMSYDITPKDRLEYMSGYWTQVSDRNSQSYVTTLGGVPVYNTQGAPYQVGPFTNTPGANNLGHDGAQHVMNALTLKRDTNGVFDYDLTLTSYNYLRDFTNATTAYGFLPSATRNAQGLPSNYKVNPTGQNTRQDGTYWRTGDARFIYRPERELQGKHVISYGLHSDQYSLNQTQQYSAQWPSSYSLGIYNYSGGKTTLNSVYVQDAWQLLPSWKATLGARNDYWNALDGHFASGGPSTSYTQVTNPLATVTLNNRANGGDYPTASKNGFQPKAALEYQMTKEFNLRGSMGRAYRMPTVSEMFQNTATAGTQVINNPYLQPQVSTAYDLTGVYRKVDAFNGAIGLLQPRVSLFMEDRWNAIFSQTSLSSSGVTTSQSANVGKALFRGVEAELVTKDMFIKGLDYSGSITFTDAHILANNQLLAPYFTGSAPCWPGNCSANGPLIAGNQYPRIPRIRIRSILTYSPSKELSLAFGARYASAAFVSLANTDFNHNNYGNVDSQYLFFDAKMNYKFEKNWTATVGIDNIGSYKAYVNPNPYPQRTYFAGIRYDFGGSDDAKINANQLGNDGAYTQGGPGGSNPSATVR
jgi:iron complex outermembrane receptor protein